MPSSPTPQPSASFETGPRAWSRLWHVLRREKRHLREIWCQEGLDESRTAQFELLQGIGDTAMIERMFIEGCWQNPDAAKVIGEIRTTYRHLLTPVSCLEAEGENALEELRQKLKIVIEQVKEQIQINQNGGPYEKITFHPEKVEEILREYQYLSGISRRAHLLIQEIEALAEDLRQMCDSSSK